MTQANLENTVLIILIAVGVGLGIYFRGEGDDQLSAILFSLAFASVLYKFLGGSQEENSLKLGVIKFGGSAAVLGGFIWLLSQVIFKEDVPTIIGESGEISLRTEPASGWYAADTKTGAPIALRLAAGDTTYRLPLHTVRTDRIRSRRYQLSEFEEEHFYLTPVGAPEDTLGQVYLSDILGESIGKKAGDLSAGDAFVFTLFPHLGGKRTSAEIENTLVRSGKRETVFPFPFIIKSYGTLYSVKTRDDYAPIVVDQEVLQKNPLVIPEKQADGSMAYWVLYIVHANFLNTDESKHYMEWTVVKVG